MSIQTERGTLAPIQFERRTIEAKPQALDEVWTLEEPVMIQYEPSDKAVEEIAQALIAAILAETPVDLKDGFEDK